MDVLHKIKRATVPGSISRIGVPLKFACGGRWAGIKCTLQEMEQIAGEPIAAVDKSEWYNYDGEGIDGAGKVTAIWHFSTPRGTVEIGDYWWNRRNELSIRVGDVRAFVWFRRWIKAKGLKIIFI